MKYHPLLHLLFKPYCQNSSQSGVILSEVPANFWPLDVISNVLAIFCHVLHNFYRMF